ncbi:DUF4407 domain-containing protein [Seonamhaeicola algicola]|uniref:DUF4407 domain-containing protein n=1 Tax=Seonamhaeicola algicola TaxID=1719036 RepID=A0A5C7AT76_9FLAO|nr:DUF4407 domain-containing protein [Seonamhaeicola algicola]TXE09705.1 DUF4407 domain-containing protein [Seonamhaeicola algicola]
MLKQFFIICSGADTDILEACSKGEQNKYAGIGATVFFTALMATLAASYALYTVFNNAFSAIFFGIVWGLLIFNLDRYIVSTIKKTGHFVDEVIQASPRILLAIIIAIVISKPLELKIFEKEINQVLLEEKNQLTLNNKAQIAEQYNPSIDALKKNITKLEQEIDSKETEVNELYNTYIAEAEGTAGTKRVGKGPVYKEKRDKHDALLAELQLLKKEHKEKIKTAELNIAQLQKNYQTQVDSTQPIINNFDGLMARVNALNKLPWLPSLFIFLLFLAIETSPILAKLLAPKGAYDLRLEDQEDMIKTNVTQNKKQRALMLQTDSNINDRIYTDIENDDALYKHKHQTTKELMQLQANAFLKNQTKVL